MDKGGPTQRQMSEAMEVDDQVSPPGSTQGDQFSRAGSL